jgi:hypothetical protein
MTYEEIIEYYKDKPEHLSISDCFVKAGYQQASGGYIKYAAKVGKTIDFKIAEPDQRWHLIESYALRRLKKYKAGVIKDNVFRYHRLKCPELLLWMAEAAGVDKSTIQTAEQQARRLIDSGVPQARNRAGELILKRIPWNVIELAMQADTKH